MDGVALSAIGILIAVFVIGLAVVISRKSPKVHQFFMKIYRIIFWNFIIRYFQASFIGFNFGALDVLQKPDASLKSIVISGLILVTQYSIVGFVAYLLFRKDLAELNKATIR